MIDFLTAEGIISLAGFSGIFTNNLLHSLKENLVDPLSHKMLPKYIFDDSETKSQEEFTNIKQLNKDDTKLKWKLFLKDLIIWIILMFILYLIWKFIIKKPQKNSSG